MDERGLALASSLVLEDGRRLGEAMAPRQEVDLRAVLALGEPRRHWIGRPRGYSKTTDVAAATGAVMLTQAPRGARLFAAAADRDQARLLLDALAGFVERTPEVRGAITFDAYRATTRAGVVLDVLAADASSAFGLRPWWLVVDELCQWRDAVGARRFLEALTTALPKTPEARMVVITTAGDPAHFSRRVYDTACAESALWRVSDAHEPPPWIPDHLVEAERRRLPESAFVRYWRNEWCQGEDTALGAEDVTACVGPRGALGPQGGNRYVLTVDLGWRHDATAMCVAHRVRRDGAWHVIVDRVEAISARRGGEVDLGAVESRVEHLARWYRAPVWVDPAQAISMAQRLRSRGIVVREHTFSASSNTHLALRLLELVRARRIELPDDDALIDELLGLRIVERGPGLFRLDTPPGGHDDRAVVVGMAAVHLDRGSSVPASGETAAGHKVTDVRVPIRLPAPGATVRYANGTTGEIGPGDWRLKHARRVRGR